MAQAFAAVEELTITPTQATAHLLLTPRRYDVIVSERPREGWAVVNDQGETVALDLDLDEDLLRAGTAREVVRMLQEARKNAGLDVTDRIRVTWSAEGETAEAVRAHEPAIADEVLAVEIAQGPAVVDAHVATDEDLGVTVSLQKA